MSDVELILEVQNLELVLSSAPQGPAGPPGEGGGAGSLDPAAAAAAGIIKVNTDDPGDDPVVYRTDEVDTLLAAKADAADLTAEASTRAAADTALDARLDTLEAISIATDGELAAAVAAEAALRSAADSSEASTRSAADTTLQTNIDGKQPLHANLTAFAALVGASDRLAYFTGAGTLSLATFTAFARTLAACADAAAVRSALGLVIGTDVAPVDSPSFTTVVNVPTVAGTSDSSTKAASTAFVQAVVAALVNSAPGVLDTLDELAAALGDDPDFAASTATALAGKQALNANLTALAGLTGAADRGVYFTAASTLALFTLTSFGRSITALADAAAARTLFGLVIGTNVQAFHANLTAFAGLSLVADRLPYADGTGTLALATFTAFARSILDDADAAAVRSTLGLGALAVLATVGTSQIDANAVTNAKLAQMADQRLKGNVSGGTADPSDLTAAQVRTMLGLAALALKATVGTADIDDAAVTLAKMANMATASLLGRNTAGSGVPEVLSASTVRSLLSLVIGTNVQAWSSILDALVAFTSISDGQTVKRSGSSYIGYTPSSSSGSGLPDFAFLR